MKKIYVANIPFSSSESELEQLFSDCGEILSVNLITDRETGRLRGFGFIEFATEDGAQAALKFDGYELDGRALKVKIAEERRGGAGGRGGRGDRGGNGGNRNRSHSGADRW